MIITDRFNLFSCFNGNYRKNSEELSQEASQRMKAVFLYYVQEDSFCKKLNLQRLHTCSLKILKSTLAAVLFYGIYNSTGVSAAIHECLGHGVLGYHLIFSYKDGVRLPSYYVAGWENFLAIGKGSGLGDKLSALFVFLTGYKNWGGKAYRGNGIPNHLGKFLGRDGRDAWISLSGSIPHLIMHALIVVTGAKCFYRTPALGVFLLTFGIADHIFKAHYPISATLMTVKQMAREAKDGHDFANFAIRMNKITSIASRKIAIVTAVAFAAFIPLVCALTFYFKRNESFDIPQDSSLKKWAQKEAKSDNLEKKLSEYFSHYPRKEQLLTIGGFNDSKALSKEECTKFENELVLFADYILERIPKEQLQ